MMDFSTQTMMQKDNRIMVLKCLKKIIANLESHTQEK